MSKWITKCAWAARTSKVDVGNTELSSFSDFKL